MKVFALPTVPGSIHVDSRERRSDRQVLILALVALDAVAITAIVIVTDTVRIAIENYLRIWPLATERHLIASILVIPTLLLLFRAQSLYDPDQILVGSREYARVAHAVTYGSVVAMFISYFAGGSPLVSRTWLLMLWALTILSVGLARFMFRRVIRRLRQRGLFRTRVVVVGGSNLGLEIARQLRGNPGEGIDVVGFLDEFLPIGQPLLDDVTVIGRPGDLATGLPSNRVDEYILVPQALPQERLSEINQLTASPNGPVFRMAVNASELLTNGLLVTHRANIPLLAMQRAQIGGVDAVLKRAVDFAGALLGLVALAPYLIFMLLRARLAGQSPLLQDLTIYSATGQLARLTVLSPNVSRSVLLRGAPALLSVLIGRLSLVGPRPVFYPRDLASHSHAFIDVKPGLTGPWRLQGPRASLVQQSIHDLAYVRKYSIWEDLRIVALTLGLVFKPNGIANLGRWQAVDTNTWTEVSLPPSVSSARSV